MCGIAYWTRMEVSAGPSARVRPERMPGGASKNLTSSVWLVSPGGEASCGALASADTLGQARHCRRVGAFRAKRPAFLAVSATIAAEIKMQSPRRWVVKRTFSWFGRNRRLAKDFENLAETLATFVTLASIQLALRAAGQGVGRDGGGLQSTDSRPSPESRR
jgi:hypothetical protein